MTRPAFPLVELMGIEPTASRVRFWDLTLVAVQVVTNSGPVSKETGHVTRHHPSFPALRR